MKVRVPKGDYELVQREGECHATTSFIVMLAGFHTKLPLPGQNACDGSLNYSVEDTHSRLMVIDFPCSPLSEEQAH